MSVKKQLLDPLGTICKLVALNFSELNTKISIHNHILWLQEPNNYQFIVRMVNGDGRENISELFYVFIRVIKWYLSNPADNNQPDENWIHISQSEELKRLIRYACSALRKLQETYEYGNVILAIQYYINILEDAVNGTYNDNKLPKYILDKETEFQNLLDYEKLRNFWDYKKLKRICDLYDGCFNVFNDEEMPFAQKKALIDGYLKSINAILELADGDFQKLIQNSSKG
ncbi:hypothetical protein QKU48_gp0664 [Fadolivirus algeromassiliense]|jgi:hypothetical protein|uniref:Uncharacterized protein n=1 Tax=Fadolivirus FV1/VV64 TaxID=3070911 RepID=A0A7D3R106_9VIRU|nr:hypothetical protein QKU48_gp0664 [Fadolivirus algeromassiliense]QKF94122.1 hypothetical protein Fadolivirus_1_664 [Fadolivirus FV1/VV64]